jgi:hypothetical protein
MFEKRTLKGTDEVLSVQRGAIENFVVCDLPGFADYADQLPIEKRVVGEEGTKWWGGMTYDQSVAAVRDGDTAGVAASDKLLKEMETLVPVSQSWRTFNSVVGMCPNVPQYLAGNPYNMRLKRRCTTATAPLSIFVELVASAGIDAKTCLKREPPCWRWSACWRTSGPSNCGASSRSAREIPDPAYAFGSTPRRWTWRAALTSSPIPACFARSATGLPNTNSIAAAGMVIGLLATMACMSERRRRAISGC